MNLVLTDCEEFRIVKIPKAKQEAEGRKDREIKRMLGLVILRGENIITVCAVAPPGQIKKQAIMAPPNAQMPMNP